MFYLGRPKISWEQMTKPDIFRRCEENKIVLILDDDWKAEHKGLFRFISKGKLSKVLD